MMFRSVFTRLLAPYVIILLCVLFLQSLLITQLFRNDYYQMVKEKLMAGAGDLSVLASEALQQQSGSGAELAALTTAMNAIRLKYDATVWLVDRRGLFFFNRIVTASDITDFSAQDQESLTPEEVKDYLEQVLQGQTLVEEGGAFLDRFQTPMLTLGYPIYVEDRVTGAIIINAKISTLSRIDARYYYIVVLFALGTTLLGAMLIFAVSRRIARPLHEMNEIAGEIARGRFDRKVNVHSRDEIGQLSESFNAMAEDLKRHEQLQSGFVANVSHELRSPVTSMQGFAQGMLDGTIPAQEREKYLTIIRDESVRLTKLIRELLDLSQIESGQFPLHIQRFEINELIRRVLARYIEQIEEKGLELEVDFKPESSYVLADADRIEQVVVNLIDNAIKYADEGGAIRLWTYQSSDKVWVSVGNTGSVIPEEDIPYVFERFYKVEKSRSGRRGTGLGLFIVQRILDQHHQTVTVRSKSPQGTTFAFSLDPSAEQKN